MKTNFKNKDSLYNYGKWVRDNKRLSSTYKKSCNLYQQVPDSVPCSLAGHIIYILKTFDIIMLYCRRTIPCLSCLVNVTLYCVNNNLINLNMST